MRAQSPQLGTDLSQRRFLFRQAAHAWDALIGDGPMVSSLVEEIVDVILGVFSAILF